MKALIVDDSKMARKSVISKLKGCVDNPEVFEAENGKEGLFLFKSIKPDVVFLDLTMPIMDGYEALEEIMKIDQDAKVVVITADIQPKAKERVLASGASEYLEKSITEEKILDVLRQLHLA